MSSEQTEEYLTEEWWREEGYENPEDVPVPDWHLAILKERMARYEAEGTTWTPWEEVHEELVEQLRKLNNVKALKD